MIWCTDHYLPDALPIWEAASFDVCQQALGRALGVSLDAVRLADRPAGTPGRRAGVLRRRGDRILRRPRALAVAPCSAAARRGGGHLRPRDPGAAAGRSRSVPHARARPRPAVRALGDCLHSRLSGLLPLAVAPRTELVSGEPFRDRGLPRRLKYFSRALSKSPRTYA